MIEEVQLEIISEKVQLFGGELALPKGATFPGGIEYYVIRPDGIEQHIPANALIRIDRSLLESRGATVVPNLSAVDFGVLEYIQSGDIQVRR
jgi:hypothetical protein